MPFLAYEAALAAVRTLKPLIDRIALQDRRLAAQLNDASAGMPLCLAEGRGRMLGDRTQLWRTAYGSARESSAALDVAIARGLLDAADVVDAERHLDRMRQLLWSSVAA
ncbi:MAG: four helix bundle protein [Actinobacteria bacterium]|nr:four helix bundle protein [Actinomycetota bacterium]